MKEMFKQQIEQAPTAGYQNENKKPITPPFPCEQECGSDRRDGQKNYGAEKGRDPEKRGQEGSGLLLKPGGDFFVEKAGCGAPGDVFGDVPKPPTSAEKDEQANR